MLRRAHHPILIDPPAIDDDPALFDPSPMWFVPGLKESLREADERDGQLGLRSLIDRPGVVSQAWRRTRREGGVQ